jgi:hypothetical protein
MVYKFYRVQIIDDNIDCVENNTFDIGMDGINPADEFAPQIVGVVDERPKDVKTLDMYKNKNRWKRVGNDSDLEEEDITSINVDQVKQYVEQINKSTLNDLLKEVTIIVLITVYSIWNIFLSMF